MTIRSLLWRSRFLLQRAAGRPGITQDEVEKAEQAFYTNYLQPGMVAFDVGANVGELSLLFSHLVGAKGQVYAFEPNSDTFDRLGAAVQRANRKNIRVNNLAVSDHIGTVELNVYGEEYSGWTTLAQRPLEKYGIDVRPIRVDEVAATTIDAYCEAHGIGWIDLLKIDVEGAEYQVIDGARRMMGEGRIGCGIFEFGQATFDMGIDPADLARLIESQGYKVRNLLEGAPVFPGGASAATAQFSMHVFSR